MEEFESPDEEVKCHSVCREPYSCNLIIPLCVWLDSRAIVAIYSFMHGFNE